MVYRSFCAQYDTAAERLDLQTALFTIGVASTLVPSVPFSPRCPKPSVPATRRSSPPEKSKPIPARRRWPRHLIALERRLDQHRLARKSSSLGWLFGKREQAEAPLKGLYVYGEVGRGKTMLMDLFFETSPVVAQAPRPLPRVHGRRARARSRLPAGDQERRGQRATIRSSAPPPRSRRKAGCCASTNSTSPISPTP